MRLFAFLLGLGATLQAAHAAPGSEKRPDVALSLISVSGDSLGRIRPGQVTSPCISLSKGGSDQYEVLQSKIIENPYDTTYVDNAYITKSSYSRVPIFQVRYPDPRYCEPFVSAYDACYGKDSKALPKNDAQTERVLTCIKQALKKAGIKENWKSLMDEALVFVARQKAEAAKISTTPEKAPPSPTANATKGPVYDVNKNQK
jgi:hypothetical protein